MPIQLSDLLRETKELSFVYDGSECTITYRHKALTPITRVLLGAGSDYLRSKRQRQQPKSKGKAKTGGGDWQEMVADMEEYLGTLAGLLVAWDVLGDDGAPLPITVAWLEQLPMSFIFAIANAMLMDGLPNPTSGEDSPGTSPQTG